MRIVRFSSIRLGSCGWVAAALAVSVGCTPAPPGSDPGNGNGNDNGSTGGPLPGGLVLEHLSGALLSVSGTSAADVYAVGADAGDGSGPMMLHYDGDGWTRLDTGLTVGDLWWITTPAVEGQFFLAGDPGVMLRYNPADGLFEEYITPGLQTMFGVWGSALDDVWAVGGDLANEDAGGVIWHYDGVQWSRINTAGFAPTGLPTLYKVWGRSADEVYAVGRLGTVLWFDGSEWTVVPSDTTRTMFTVHGNDELIVAVGGSNSGVIQELEGDAFVEHAEPVTPQMNGVFVADDGTAISVGIAGLVTRRNAAARWPLQPTSVETIFDFHATWIDDEGGIWAVGGDLSVNLNEGIVAYFGDRRIAGEVSP